MNYYEVLDLPATASAEEIRQAYRELVEIHHPDRMQDLRADVRSRAEVRLRLINQAYAVLRDPAERARYDEALGVEAAPEVHFAPKGNPSVARGRLRDRLAEVERHLGEASQQIHSLRPRLDEQALLDQRWERYSLAALVLVWPYLFVGLWTANTVAFDPFAVVARLALGLLLLVGYLSLLVILKASRTPLSQPTLLRLLLAVPLAIVLLVATILIAAPRSMQLVVLLGGYAALVWQGAGRALARHRDEVLIAGSKIQHLEEDIRSFRSERDHLQAELARL